MKRIVAFLIIIISTSCVLRDEQDRTQQSGAMIFTFDDQYIDEWYAARNKFQEYNIKATFFINRPQNLTFFQIKKLRELQEDGHEIGCHGLNHLNATGFRDSVDMYFIKEVEPALEILESLGFVIKSFAYPFGNSTDLIDSLLLTHIQYLRKATWNSRNTTIDYYDDIFASSKSFRIINSMGIDNNYGITADNIETGINRAVRNNEVLVLHCHNIDTTGNDFVTDPGFLELIFRLSGEKGLKSIRVCDLEGFFSNN